MRIRFKAFALVLFGAAVLSGCAVAGPHSTVSNIAHNEHPEVISGDLDWGSEVNFDVVNQGERGMVHVTVTLSSSEGQWVRSQDLLFEAGQVRHLTYFFQEPTINVTNLQALVRVDP